MTHDSLALGAMLFGTTIDERTSFELLDAYVDLGGTWIDTADCYAFWADATGAGGRSELVLGRWLAARPGVRDRVRIATKVGCAPLWPGSYPAHTTGVSAPVVHQVAAQSRQRMGVDHLDLFWVHRDDRATPLAETVGAFGELVTRGVVGEWGWSNTALWRVQQAESIAGAAGTARARHQQLRYSYLQPRPLVRDRTHDHRFGWITDDHLDHALSTGTALWAYSPLMSGAYDREDRPVHEAFDHPGTTRRLAVLRTVAGDLGVSRSEVVLAWLVGGEPRIRPVLGVSTRAQLEAGLRGVRLELPADARAALDEAW